MKAHYLICNSLHVHKQWISGILLKSCLPPKNGVKAKLTEGGTLSPAFLYNTHSRPSVRQSDALVYITDWFPTLLQLAGLEIPTGLNLDGVNQKSIFEKPNTYIRSRFIYGIIEDAYEAKLFKMLK